MGQKGFKEIIVLSGVLIAGISLFLIFLPKTKTVEIANVQVEIPTSMPRSSPSPTNYLTNDWKTYESRRFFIKFSYPSKYVLVNEYENTYPDQGFIHLYTQEGYEWVKEGQAMRGPDLIQIGAYSNPKNLSALDWAKSDTSHSNFSGIYNTEYIANTEALYYVVEGMGTGYTWVLSQGDYIYTFDVLGKPEMVNDLKQILKNVSFVK